MKEFRVAKCLSDDGRIIKYAIFKDGSRRKPILKTNYGREYFEVDNWINSDPELVEFNYTDSVRELAELTFNERFSDMIQSINKGYGDMLYPVSKIFYFLDRKFGETLRKESIETWKDYIFKYTVTIAGKYIDKNTKKFTFEKPQPEGIYFDTAKDAIEFANQLIDEAYLKCMTFIGEIYFDNKNTDAMKRLDMLDINNVVSDDLVFYILCFKEGTPIHFDPTIKDVISFLKNIFTIRQEPVFSLYKKEK